MTECILKYSLWKCKISDWQKKWSIKIHEDSLIISIWQVYINVWLDVPKCNTRRIKRHFVQVCINKWQNQQCFMRSFKRQCPRQNQQRCMRSFHKHSLSHRCACYWLVCIVKHIHELCRRNKRVYRWGGGGRSKMITIKNCNSRSFIPCKGITEKIRLVPPERTSQILVQGSEFHGTPFKYSYQSWSKNKHQKYHSACNIHKTRQNHVSCNTSKHQKHHGTYKSIKLHKFTSASYDDNESAPIKGGKGI